MSKLQIFGATRSRTMRALWLAEELGLDYEQRAWMTWRSIRPAKYRPLTMTAWYYGNPWPSICIW